MIKTCSHCEKELDESQFYHRTRPSGKVYVNSKCKKCCIAKSGGPGQVPVITERMNRNPLTWVKRILSTTRGNAKRKNREHTLDLQYLVDLWNKQEGVCALTGVSMLRTMKAREPRTASLDRIDNSKGYIQGNVQFVTTWANRSKFIFSVETFEELILSSSEHIRKKQKLTL